VASIEDGGREYAGKPLADWIAGLAHPDPGVREVAALALSAVPMTYHLAGEPVPEALVRALVGALGDPEARVRGQAARALGAASESARHALPRLVELLSDDAEGWAALAGYAAAVGDLGGAREAATALLLVLRAGDGEAREAAAAALAKADLTGLGAEADLTACLADGSGVVRTWACWCLWKLTGQAGNLVPILTEALQDGRSRLDAARLLCRMRGEAAAALPRLLALQGDPDRCVRLQAVRATIHLPCPDGAALPVLEALRDDPSGVVRSYAADGLARRGRA
jgi:HEAT repeat protein